VIILIFCHYIFFLNGQISSSSDTLKSATCSDTLGLVSKRYFGAAGFMLGTNIAVWSFDRFLLRAPYSQINLGTIQQNFKTGFVWDNDMFATNLYAHPYHGGLYFNAARYHGINFWQSLPFTTFGSLMWEFCMEKEPPAINDLLTTVIGGACLGEMTFRISDLVVDDRATGFNRFKSELLLTLVSPIRGLNRIVTGNAWKIKSSRGNLLPLQSICLNASSGYCILLDESRKINTVTNAACFNIGLDYGDAFSNDNEKPYDYFSLQLGGNLLPTQPLISRINVLGKLFSENYTLENTKSEMVVGVFHHLNFYHAYSNLQPVVFNFYQIAEAASLGVGMLYRTKLSENVSVTASTHINAILLGASQTDYYKFENRDYNMGSGFSTKLNVELKYGKKASMSLHWSDYQIYSWVGMNTNGRDLVNTNVQGDKGNTTLRVANLSLKYFAGKHFLLHVENAFYYRKNKYDFYPAVNQSVIESKFFVGYVF